MYESRKIEVLNNEQNSKNTIKLNIEEKQNELIDEFNRDETDVPSEKTLNIDNGNKNKKTQQPQGIKGNKNDNPSPISFMPTEIGTLLFFIYRIVISIIYFVLHHDNFLEYIWIGHFIECIVCFAGIPLHLKRLYKHFYVISKISMNNKYYTFLFTLIPIVWFFCYASPYYGIKCVDYQHNLFIWCIAVVILSVIAAFNQIGSYYYFDIIYDQGEIQWFTWWIDSPLITLNLTLSYVLIIERDIWVVVWIGDLLFHLYKFVYLFNKQHPQHNIINNNDDNNNCNGNKMQISIVTDPPSF